MAAQDEFMAALFGGNSIKTTPDITQFENTIAANDYWKLAAAPVLSAKFDTSMWTPGQTFAATAGQAFLGSLLKGIGDYSEGQQLAKIAPVLPNLYANPNSVAAPEGVDPLAFNQLKLSALKQRQTQQESMIQDLFSKRPEIAAQALGMGARRNMADPSVAAAGATLGGTAHDKFKQYYQDNLLANIPPVQAAAEARQQVEGEIKANAGAFTTEAGVRKHAETLREIADKVDASLATGAYTGTGGGLNQVGNRLLGSLGSSEAAQRAANNSVYENIIPQVIAEGRPPGTRLTEFEWKQLVAAKPSIDKTPEENRRLNSFWRAAADQSSRYADLLAAVREAGGTPSDADRIWAKVAQAPLFVGDKTGMRVNEARPDWTSIWQPNQPFPSASAAPAMSRLQFIAKAKAAGLSMQEAKDQWLQLGGE